MASGGMNFSPNAPQTLALRPLVNGMITEGHSSLAPPTSFKEVKGFDVTLSGLRRTGGFIPISTDPITLLFDNGQSVADRQLSERVEDFTVLVQTDGTPVGLAITNRLLYTYDGSTGFLPVPWSAASYTIESPIPPTPPAVDVKIVVNGDITGVDIESGDWIQLDTDTTATLWKIKAIDYDVTTPGDTTITLDGGPGTVTATTFKIFKPFKTVQGSYVGWTTAGGVSSKNGIYLVDGITTYVFKYTDEYMTSMKLVTVSGGATRSMFTAKTITYFKERLWFGNTVEPDGGGTLKPLTRIRWTDVLNWDVSPLGNYSDQDYRSGPIQRLIGADTILLAFTSDAIYYGRQSNLVGLPYAFYQLQTGNVSIAGPKAATGLLGGCLFVGPDDVYTIFMTEAGPTLERVGLSVANRLIGGAKELDMTTVKVDPLESRVVVATSEGGQYLDRLWFWNYKTKGWSFLGADLNTDGFTLQAISGANYVDQLLIDELDGSWDFDTNPYAGLAFDALLRTSLGVDVFAFDENGYLYKFDPSVSNHSIHGLTVPVKTSLVTQDLDFDRPDDTKTFTELGLRMDDQMPDRSAAVSLLVEGSTDRGRSWRTLGTARFAVGDDEDKINFRLTGSAVRFRITSSDVVEPWTLLEMTLRARARTDREPQRGTARA